MTSHSSRAPWLHKGLAATLIAVSLLLIHRPSTLAPSLSPDATTGVRVALSSHPLLAAQPSVLGAATPPSLEHPSFAKPLETLAQGKKNIYVREDEVIAAWLSREPELPAKLILALREIPSAQQVPRRLEALNTLEALLSHERFTPTEQRAAETALVQLLREPIDSGLTESQKRTLAAEKYDALTALIRHAPESGLEEFRRLRNAALQRVLAPAAINALWETGASLAEAKSKVASALAP